MVSTIKAYDLLLSYPSDLAHLTEPIKAAVNDFNCTTGRRLGVVVRAHYWQTGTYSERSYRPQESINKQVADNCDLVFACFWTKFGSPTGLFGSGTEEEIARAYQGDRQVFLFFLGEEVDPSSIDPKQFMKLAEFKDKCSKEHLYHEPNNRNELLFVFQGQLEKYFTERVGGGDGAVDGSGNAGRKSILWVDDRPENNYSVRGVFEKRGIDVFIALSTMQALDLIESKNFDVIISDMGRKEGPAEGYVLLDKIRSEGLTTPFIIYAGSRSPQHLIETRKHHGQGCTGNSRELVDMVFRALVAPETPWLQDDLESDLVIR